MSSCCSAYLAFQSAETSDSIVFVFYLLEWGRVLLTLITVIQEKLYLPVFFFVQTLVCAKDRLFLSILLDCGAELFHLSSLSLRERGSERMGRGKGI